MAIKPICKDCERELKSFGAILLSPPDKRGKVRKIHLCKECFKRVEKFIKLS